jgi:tetratricopeptide (TPR) repeat protein
MVCARCGQVTAVLAGRCSACGAAFPQLTVAAGVIPIDTTGLPPGATFGAATGLGTIDGTAALTSGVLDVTEGGAGPQPASRTAGPLHVGQAFGPRYHIIKLLGAGGMGAVYQAWDSELSVAVALKVIRTDRNGHSALSAAEKQFKQELLLARQVTHKNVVRIHDLGEIDGIKYITMPYVQGDELATVIRRDGKLPIAHAMRFARQIADGLRAAHEAGVVHRDLKPANVMIRGAGENPDDAQALIMDFGISASADRAATTSTVLGTLEYMAPEQATGGGVDGRADIYAYGLILYEMLTGPRTVATATPQARIDAMKQRFAEGLVPVGALDRSIPEPLEAFVMRCLEREPAARFQTATELGDALARLDDAGELIPIAARLTKRMMAAAAAIVLLLLGGTYVATRRLVTPPKQHDAVSILIADFRNSTGDPAFDGTLEQALGTSVEGASFVSTYRRDEAQKLVVQLKAGSKLDEKAARLVSVREGINVVLAGSIEPKGSGYTIAVRAIDPANGNTLATTSVSASGKDDVPRRLGTMGARIRSALGDTAPESERLAASETVSAASLEALREYSHAQDLLFNGKDEEAILYYRRAIEKDPNFGRAYSGWGISAVNLGRQQEATEAYKKALSLLDRMTEREKYRTLGTYYLQVARNYDKAIENYTTLVKLYPYDRSGHGNLALAHFYTRNFANALEEGRRAIEGGSRDLLYRNNYALYAMYAGNFKAAAEEARAEIQLDPRLMKAYLPLAIAAIDSGDSSAARDAYARMEQTGVSGESLAGLGLADLAMYEGRFAEAEAIVKTAIPKDETINNTGWIAAKSVVMGEAYLSEGKTALAIGTARRVLKLMGREPVSVLAANILVRAGAEGDARGLALDLSKQLQPESRAYARIIEGEIALRQGRTIDAVEAFLAARKLADLWLARLGLGIAYVEAAHYAEGLAELELCQRRRGEATAIFLDDLPSFRYLAPLPYWLARSQEGIGLKPAAADNYKKYIALRVNTPRDPLAADARRRLASQ